MREAIRINEEDPKYGKLVNEAKEGMTPDNLVIVARSERNRKTDTISPLVVKNGIYFYLAYQFGEGKLAFPSKYSPEDVYTAKANTVAKARIGGMLDVLIGDGFKLEDFDPLTVEEDPMVCLTSDSKVNGAGILYCEEFLKKAKEKIGDFRILPSSIHEILLVPDSAGIEVESLDEMVRSVNAQEVSDEDYLADRSFAVSEWL